MPTSNAIYGYNGTAGNELGQLFYSELGGTGPYNIPKTANFTNEQDHGYWSGTEYTPILDRAWIFYTSMGFQLEGNKDFQGYAWVVSPGFIPGFIPGGPGFIPGEQASPVPVPGAVWLMGTGLVGLLSLKRRGYAG